MKTMTVIGRSRPGLLADITDVLAKDGVEIDDFSGHVVGDTAVITLRARHYRRGFRALAAAGYHVYASETLLIRLDEAPGALAGLSRRLADAGVDIRGLHLVNRDASAGIVALETADQDKAREVLGDLLVR